MTGHSAPQATHFGYYILVAVSTLPNTVSFALKEKMFRKERNLDLFVVNSASSLFQLLWWPLMIPLTVVLHQTGNTPLLTFVHDGFECLSGKTPTVSGTHMELDCTPNPYPYLVYIGVNLVFNIFVLLLIKRASALQSFMSMNGILPASVFLFLHKWPLLGRTNIDIYMIMSLTVVMIGLVLYRIATVMKDRQKRKIGGLN